jgi:predicted metal-dependent enzyme (double-stranded beta helix superfamily)
VRGDTTTEGVLVFDPETFATECRRAASSGDALAAVQEVVATAIGDPASIDATLGTEFKGESDTLLSSADLTVQRIQWPPGIDSSPHEHRMWAVVGVYTGMDQNRTFRRSSTGVEACDHQALGEGDVLVFQQDAIHSVENPLRTRTAGLHVYGGDILSVERSAWGPDGREVSFAMNAAAAKAMFQAMRDVGVEYGEQLDDEARYLAATALRAACERERRYPTDAEARRIVEHAWQRAPC